MAVSQRPATRSAPRPRLAWLPLPSTRRSDVPGPRARPLASPGQIAVIYRWGTWLLACGLIVTGSSATYGHEWQRTSDVYLLLALTLAVNIVLTLALRPYIRLMRRFPPVLLLDVIFCLAVYARSNIWTSPFQFYSYSALMLPVTIFFFSGALAGSVLFLALDLMLLYRAGDTYAWAQAGGFADTYLMQLAIVPLLAFVFAYPNRLYAQLRRAQRRLDEVEREQLLTAERTRIAQSLHDSVAQMLFGIGMLAETALARLTELRAPVHSDATDATTDATAPAASVEALRSDDPTPLTAALRQVRDLATRGNHEMRRAIYALNEPAPSRRGLADSLRALLADVAGRSGIETTLTVSGIAGAAPASGSASGSDSPPDNAPEPVSAAPDAPDAPDANALPLAAGLVALPEPVTVALYKVAREALANVEKHAAAAHVWIELTGHPATLTPRAAQVTLSVRDDGAGFRRALLAAPGEPDEDEQGQLHFGLGNMRRAIAAVGGRFEVTTAPGRGTTVHATVPVP